MPGKLVVGIIADFRREDMGEYTCPTSTLYGVEEDEIRALIEAGFTMTNKNSKDNDGLLLNCSAFKIMRVLGKSCGYEPLGDPICTDPAAGRKTLVYTLTKDA